MSNDLRTSVLLQPRWGARPPPPFIRNNYYTDHKIHVFKASLTLTEDKTSQLLSESIVISVNLKYINKYRTFDIWKEEHLNCRERKKDLTSFPETKSRCSNLGKDRNLDSLTIVGFPIWEHFMGKHFTTCCQLWEGRVWDCEEMDDDRSPPINVISVEVCKSWNVLQA